MTGWEAVCSVLTRGQGPEEHAHVASTSRDLGEQRGFCRDSSTGRGPSAGPTCQLRSLTGFITSSASSRHQDGVSI